MDDVAGEPGGAAHGDHGPDGGQLHARGPRLQERGVQVRVTAAVVRMGPALVMTLNQSQSQFTLIRIRDPDNPDIDNCGNRLSMPCPAV